MDFIRHTIWPWVKVKIIYWWWIIKYRGKKNIPPELIFGRIIKNIERMKENLEKAFSLGKDDMTKEELLNFHKIMDKADELERKINESSLKASKQNKY